MDTEHDVGNLLQTIDLLQAELDTANYALRMIPNLEKFKNNMLMSANCTPFDEWPKQMVYSFEQSFGDIPELRDAYLKLLFKGTPKTRSETNEVKQEIPDTSDSVIIQCASNILARYNEINKEKDNLKEENKKLKEELNKLQSTKWTSINTDKTNLDEFGGITRGFLNKVKKEISKNNRK